MPLLILSIVYAGGILYEDSLGFHPALLTILIVGSPVCLIRSLRRSTRESILTLLIWFFVLGAANYLSQTEHASQNQVRSGSGTFHITIEENSLPLPQHEHGGHRVRTKVSAYVIEEDESFWGKRALPLCLYHRGLMSLVKGQQYLGNLTIKSWRPKLNPWEIMPEERTRRQGCVANARSKGSLVLMENAGFGAQWWQAKRSNFARFLDRRIESSEVGALARALLLGDRSLLSGVDRRPWNRAGLGHLLAISGLHIAILFSLFFLSFLAILSAIPTLFERLNSTVISSLFALLVSLIFAEWVGMGVSVYRAAGMLTIAVLGRLWGHEYRALNSLGGIALAAMALNPLWVFSVGFQLSFMATVAILLIPVPITKGMSVWVLQSVRLTMVTTVVTLPIVVNAFGEVPLLGFVFNLFFVPLVGFVILPSGILLLFLWSLGIDAPILWDLWNNVFFQLRMILVMLADHSLFVLFWSNISWFFLVSYYGGAWGLLLAWSGKWMSERTYWLMMGALLMALFGVTVEMSREREFNLFQPYIGQGSATLLGLSGGKTVLIDAGPSGFDGYGAPIWPALRWYLGKEAASKVHVALLTHADADHIGGFFELIDQVEIKRFYIHVLHKRRKNVGVLLQKLRGKGVEVYWLEGTQGKIEVDDETYIRFFSIGEEVHTTSKKRTRYNDHSTVFLLHNRNKRVLFAGDIHAWGESKLLNQLEEVDILMVPHHGSRTSTTAALLAVLRPKIAIISCGYKNRFGFPHQPVLNRLDLIKAKILRTDRHGAIMLTDSKVEWVGDFVFGAAR
ncbi:MAG: DNA internalization-related competence protein ComEC/Rec2 [Myxococcota bacterium]|nr:DNA internalization-related competence protein ComEC/Rec2 [Myxococcota bacterium]